MGWGKSGRGLLHTQKTLLILPTVLTLHPTHHTPLPRHRLHFSHRVHHPLHHILRHLRLIEFTQVIHLTYLILIIHLTLPILLTRPLALLTCPIIIIIFPNPLTLPV